MRRLEHKTNNTHKTGKMKTKPNYDWSVLFDCFITKNKIKTFIDTIYLKHVHI